MKEFITAIGLVFVLEGLIYALAPGSIKKLIAALERISPDTLRMGGLAAAAFGVFIVWVAKSFTFGS